MIDYAKLKQAVQLCEKIPTHFIRIDFCSFEHNSDLDINLMHDGGLRGDCFDDLDELIEKLHELTKPQCPFEIGDGYECLGHVNQFSFTSGDYTIRDNFVYRLKREECELTKPEPKYKKGQIIWLLNAENEPEQTQITDFDLGSEEKYLLAEFSEWATEDQVYATLQDLIEAQIKHWQEKLHTFKCRHTLDSDNRVCITCNQYVEACKHESDDSDANDYLKCKKCGGLYR